MDTDKYTAANAIMSKISTLKHDIDILEKCRKGFLTAKWVRLQSESNSATIPSCVVEQTIDNSLAYMVKDMHDLEQQFSEL